MWNLPNKNKLSSIPKLYETENIKLADKMIHLHFFIGASDWYIAEFDGNDTFFGYVILNGDTEMAEWGYISFNELKNLKFKFLEVDNDLYWTPKKFKDLKLSISAC